MVANHLLQKLFRAGEVAEMVFLLIKASFQISGLDLLINACSILVEEL